ncbi:hypothetical protein QBC32DRAFT_146190 [Pseudoneurospora amorphoporcata]|uniref:Secreted protein n=1 Tax=Pseudoneurospora amorphoporcata TaxID=241081 RepID=A0AAN6SGD8_9PEZI|nr:hypothetical protein QBC32DRAFT_146190 [Pseudoneurospora amorphoporcata]
MTTFSSFLFSFFPFLFICGFNIIPPPCRGTGFERVCGGDITHPTGWALAGKFCLACFIFVLLVLDEEDEDEKFGAGIDKEVEKLVFFCIHYQHRCLQHTAAGIFTGVF